MDLAQLLSLLEIDANDEKTITKLDYIYHLVLSAILTYIDEKGIPKEIEWVLIEAVIRRWNMFGKEHLSSASVEGLSATYKGDDSLISDELKKYLDDHIAIKEEPKRMSSKRVRLI